MLKKWIRTTINRWNEYKKTRKEDKLPGRYAVSVSVNGGEETVLVQYPFKPTPTTVHDRAIRKIKQHYAKKYGRKNVPIDLWQYDPEITEEGEIVTAINFIDWKKSWTENLIICAENNKRGEEFVTGQRKMFTREEMIARGIEVDDLQTLKLIDSIIEKELTPKQKNKVKETVSEKNRIITDLK